MNPPKQLIACSLRDFPEWHKQRSRYAVWTLLLDQPELQQQLERCQRHLSAWLHPQQRQLHLTLYVAGFPSHTPRYADCISWQQLRLQQQAIRQLGLQPFRLQLTQLETFAHAPYIKVANNSQLTAIRQCLAHLSPEQRFSEYLPHITLGLYRRAPSLEQFNRLRQSCPFTSSHWTVRSLYLQSYLATDQLGPLQTHWHYRF